MTSSIELEYELALSEARDIRTVQVSAAFTGAVQGHGWMCSSAYGQETGSCWKRKLDAEQTDLSDAPGMKQPETQRAVGLANKRSEGKAGIATLNS